MLATRLNVSINSILYPMILSISFNLFGNILFQKPKKISSEEIEELVNNWETSFNWILGKLQFTCCYENNKSSFILRLLNVPIRSYNFEYIANIKKYMRLRNQQQFNYYFAEPLKIENSKPNYLNLDELCKLIENKNFIFYTGAGISASGKVATMHDLEKSLKMKDGKLAFIKEIFLNPKGIADAFSAFCKSAIHGEPTKAHYALNEIALSKNICIITENVDLLQQRTGGSPIFAYSSDLFSVTEKDLLEVDFVICVGLSHDDRGFLAHYKKNNPNGKIIAINLSIPNYLSAKDFIMQEDLQVLLPKLATYLKLDSIGSL